LRHEKAVDLASFIRKTPTPMRLTHYHRILKSLSKQRDPSGRRFANQADAYNLSFLIDINRLSQNGYKNCHQPSLSLFRLLTATNTIHSLDRKRDAALHLQLQADEGGAFDLLETPKGLHTKRFLFHMADTEGISILRELLVETVRARATLDQLSDNLHDVDSSLEEIISLLPEPKGIISDQLFRSVVGGLLKLESYLTRYQSLTQQLIARELRYDLMPRPSGDERFEFQHLAGQSIATLRNLISSIASTAENFGYLAEVPIIRDKASKAWRNPLLSLQHLGYRIVIENGLSSRRWRLFRIDDDSDTLAIDIYEDATVVSWPSQFPASYLLAAVGRHIANTGSENQRVDLEVIDWNGAERSFRLAARELPLSDSELLAAAFVRLTFGPVTLAAELFCLSPEYQPRTGIVTVNLDPALALELFFALTTCRIDFLLKRILWKELVTLATAPPDKPHP
jgi:hypothetical protein